MKTKLLPILTLLTLFLSTISVASAQPTEVPDCVGQNLTGAYDYEVLDDRSSVNKDGNVVTGVLCNYTMSTRASHPAGAGLISGMAITITFACPEQSAADWQGKANRDDAISRTSDSVLLRDTGTFTGFSGEHTIQEKMFLLLDSHTNATIVVNTDALPNTKDEPIYSANTARSLAASLASTYAPRANDPACGLPPLASGGTSTPIASLDNFTGSYHDLPLTTAIAVAVGAGTIVVLAAGGLLSGAGNLGLGSTTAPSPATASPAGFTQPASTVSSSPIGSTSTTYTPNPSSSPPAQTIAQPNYAYTPAQPQPSANVTTSIQPDPSPLGSDLQTSQPAPTPPLADPIPDPPAPSIVQPIVQAAETILAVGGAIAQAGSVSGSSSTSNNSGSSDSDSSEEIETEKRCPEAEAYLFGLPSINSRSDCPGQRAGMGPWQAGIDFTSKNEHGITTNLSFDACVTGVVTYTGGPFNMIEVKLENNNRVQFLHASEIYVFPGRRVESNTKLGKTGGVGPEGPDQYEIHLHIQAIDKQGNMIDPDCAISGGENRELKIHGSDSPYRDRIQSEAAAGTKLLEAPEPDTPEIDIPIPIIEVAAPTPIAEPEPIHATNQIQAPEPAESALSIEPAPAIDSTPTIEPVPAVESIPAIPPILAIDAEPAIPNIPSIETEPLHIEPPQHTTDPLTSTEPLPPVLPPDDPKTCAQCGQVNPPNAKFCKNCGQRLS